MLVVSHPITFDKVSPPSQLQSGSDAIPYSSFGTALKDIHAKPGVPLTLFDYQVPEGAMSGCIQMMWFTGAVGWETFLDSIVTITVDNDPSSTISFALGLAHNIGFDSMKAPWGLTTHGHLAYDGGLFNTYQIPFLSSIVITVTAPATDTQTNAFYFKVSGLLNYAPRLLSLGIDLPTTSRLRLEKLNDIHLQPEQWQSLAQQNNSAGVMFLHSIVLDASTVHCLEGTHRAFVDGEQIVISSGFEDYFLSGNYFDAGKYRTELAGMTTEDRFLFPNQLAAYRFHTHDPIFWTKSFDFQWQNGMYGANHSLAAGPANITSYVWFYTW